MITGLDSTGQIYLSLLQSNSNAKIMEIFFHSLVRVLEKERVNLWENSVILLDNAPYHTTPHTLKVFKELNIPILFTGPHSYDGAPCELFFVAFKKADINPRRIPTGNS